MKKFILLFALLISASLTTVKAGDIKVGNMDPDSGATRPRVSEKTPFVVDQFGEKSISFK